MFVQEMLSIFIRARMTNKDGIPMAWIVIEDNGAGFTQEWLNRQKHADAAEDGARVGIANIRRTLQLLYKRDDLLELSNNTESTGARVELWIPVRPADHIQKEE
ncbi:hypothetical protein D3C73_1491780 [compost metagenome]